MTMTWSFSGYKNCLANIFATGPGTIRARWLQVTGSMGADQTSENSWLHDMTWCTEVKELSVRGMMKFHEIATFVIAFSSMKPFGLGLANETQTCRMFDPKDRWCPQPLRGARHVFSIRIYMLYVYTQYIMWLEGVLNLCVYHSSLTRWQELMCWSNLNMVQCINAWRCFFATSNSWKCQAIWGRSSELSASQRIQRISIVRTFNMCSLHDQWRGQLQRREWQTLTRWRVLHLYCRLVSHADLVEWVWTV